MKVPFWKALCQINSLTITNTASTTSVIHSIKCGNLKTWCTCPMSWLCKYWEITAHVRGTHGRDVIEIKEVLYILKIFAQLKKLSSRNIEVHGIRPSTKNLTKIQKLQGIRRIGSKANKKREVLDILTTSSCLSKLHLWKITGII